MSHIQTTSEIALYCPQGKRPYFPETIIWSDVCITWTQRGGPRLARRFSPSGNTKKHLQNIHVTMWWKCIVSLFRNPSFRLFRRVAFWVNFKQQPWNATKNDQTGGLGAKPPVRARRVGGGAGPQMVWPDRTKFDECLLQAVKLPKIKLWSFRWIPWLWMGLGGRSETEWFVLS